MSIGEAAFLSFSPSDILVDHTRVSALPICSSALCTFVWPNFFNYIFFSCQVLNEFLLNFSIIYF